jgi:hypothetical protein
MDFNPRGSGYFDLNDFKRPARKCSSKQDPPQGVSQEERGPAPFGSRLGTTKYNHSIYLFLLNSPFPGLAFFNPFRREWGPFLVSEDHFLFRLFGAT